MTRQERLQMSGHGLIQKDVYFNEGL